MRKVTIATGAVSTLAGSATHGETDGIGAAASFDVPTGLATDGLGNLYVADPMNPAIRKVVLANGAVSTLAGGPSLTGHTDGIGSAARLNSPGAIATDGLGHLFVSDVKNAMIRWIDIATGAVTTLAGSPGVSGSADGTGPAANFNTPYGLVFDGAGNLYVADGGSSTIRKIVASNGSVTTFAGSPGTQGSVDGSGSAARFVTPFGMAADATNIYVADRDDNTIRQIALVTAAVKTIAGSSGMQGSADGIGPSARFFSPEGLAYDGAGNLYVSDKGSSTIRKVVIATGAVSTIAGSPGITGGRDGQGSDVRFSGPVGLSTDGKGSLYVADAGNGTIRKVDLASGTVTTWIGVAAQIGVRLGPLPAGLNSPQGVVALGPAQLAIVDQVERSSARSLMHA